MKQLQPNNSCNYKQDANNLNCINWFFKEKNTENNSSNSTNSCPNFISRSHKQRFYCPRKEIKSNNHGNNNEDTRVKLCPVFIIFHPNSPTYFQNFGNQ